MTDVFEKECRDEITRLGRSAQLADLTRSWFDAANDLKYSYHFRSLGRPIIQYPQDIVAIQELIWSVRPTLIIETGIAHGGSLVMSASMLALLDYQDALVEGSSHLDVRTNNRRVVGIDIDIRNHNRAAIDAHFLRHKIEMIEGSSIDPGTVEQVRRFVRPDDRVLVILDSNHTHDHVLAELNAYAPFVSQGSYCVVFDTVIEDLRPDSFGSRPWNVGNNPKTAVFAYLSALDSKRRLGADGGGLHFVIDKEIQHKLLITVAPDGYLRRRHE